METISIAPNSQLAVIKPEGYTMPEDLAAEYRYLSEIGNFERPSDEDCFLLAQEAQDGRLATEQLEQETGLLSEKKNELQQIVKLGQEAKWALVLSHLTLVPYVLATDFKFKPPYALGILDYADLVQAGTLALIKATEHHDPYSGAKFSTFAVHVIRNGIVSLLNSNNGSWSNSEHSGQFAREYIQTHDHLTQTLQREPNIKDIALSMGISERRATDYARLVEPALSLEKLHEFDPEQYAQAFEEDPDNIPELEHAQNYDKLLNTDKERTSFTDKIIQNELSAEVEDIFGALSERQEDILGMHYGLGANQEPLGYEQLSKKLGMSETAAKVAAFRARNKIRELFGYRLRDYLD